MRQGLLILTLFALPLVGQTTWGGLRFGMTEAEVRVAIRGRVEATGNTPGTQFYTPFRIKSVTIGPATGIGTLSFDVKKKTLQRVWVNLSRKDETTLAELSTDEVAARVAAYDYVSKQLLEKYGRPVNETGRCPSHDEAVNHYLIEPLNTLKCTRLWRDHSQTIEMDFSLVGSSLFLTVEYKYRSAASSEI